MILIIGAGLAGLSTAYHLGDRSCRVIEKEKEAGGLCRSYQMDGFTFDMTGHLLHFRQQTIRALVEGLLAGKLQQHSRRSYIYSYKTYTEYPYQVNTYGLPPEVVRECLMGFIATLTAPPSGLKPEERSFKQWILESLGEGFAKHFMVPFNEKLWQVSLDELTSDWVSWLVPKPELKDVINGALGIKDKAFGYNPSFLYPAQGGIGVLPNAFLTGIKDIAYGSELMEVDTARRRATFYDGRAESYDTLVSTMPVPELIRRCTDLPKPVREAAEGLRCASVYNINLGVARERVSDKHWIYFPEREYPFYRAGFPMNFSPALGRPGCSSLYVEISHQPEIVTPPAELIAQVRAGMERAGIFRPDDDIVVADVKDIRYAYVLFDRHRARVLPGILAELESRGIHSIGRYGRWEHTSMEDAIAQGKQLAEKLRAA
ncbi:MAG TPA: FAD-dependent oxidoreductase [Nitrospiraceae bacterium]|nr:FAD-dependent oxidoreductase [Nitrospiraceae bacterium]